MWEQALFSLYLKGRREGKAEAFSIEPMIRMII